MKIDNLIILANIKYLCIFSFEKIYKSKYEAYYSDPFQTLPNRFRFENKKDVYGIRYLILKLMSTQFQKPLNF
ncbi:unnamed protein product [Paramecium sonneborni]|uniref:Uncharacterized protein n=1 Tax=Paramecium sonneborni TaxID=65129 RepID=A0A8S1RAN6_9CILI|nr:unnamed protein product [Paramecium sonneborni]